MKSEVIKDLEFDLDQVKGKVKLTKKVTLTPFETIQVSAKSSVRGHHKRVLVIMEKLNTNADSATEPVKLFHIISWFR